LKASETPLLKIYLLHIAAEQIPTKLTPPRLTDVNVKDTHAPIKPVITSCDQL